MVNIFVTVLICFLVSAILYGKQKKYYEDRLRKEIAGARNDSVDKSSAVIRGKVTEELVSLIPGFPFEGSDCKFFGTPIDYIIFNGMSRVRDGEQESIDEILFVDIKTGKATLSPVERKIKECVNEKRVRWITIHVGENGIEKIR
jgi:predicted Holliday junction resolvase-like endonuclease